MFVRIVVLEEMSRFSYVLTNFPDHEAVSGSD